MRQDNEHFFARRALERPLERRRELLRLGAAGLGAAGLGAAGLGAAGLGAAGLRAAGVAGLAFTPGIAAAAEKVRTTARIVIAGAGAAGLAAASRLSAALDGATITLIDARRQHFYQPGFTLVGSGIKPASYVESATADYVPGNVELVEQRVAEFDPEANKVVTDGGQTFAYDFLIVATGLKLVAAIGEAAEEANHHPDIDLRYPTVTYQLTTHSENQLTSYDVALAQRIDERVAAHRALSWQVPLSGAVGVRR